MKIDTTKRTDADEIMDDFELKGDELEKTLQDLDNINKWLGGNKITLQGVKKLLKDHPKSTPVYIADVGCGNGALLREIARWGRRENFQFKCTGIDANPNAIGIAERLSNNFPEIDFEALNVFNEKYRIKEFDIIHCTLTLHHFKNHQIKDLLSLFVKQVKIGLVINDLHRSKIAYYLFQIFCAVFIKNKIARTDGLVSILRGFKKEDIQKFSQNIPVKHQEIIWKWAFRYQWVIWK